MHPHVGARRRSRALRLQNAVPRPPRWAAATAGEDTIDSRRTTIMNGPDFKTAVQKGNAFRDLIASMLEAAGFAAETETRERFKKVDVRWRREDLDGPVKYVVEARDHAVTVGLDECREFLIEYGTL